jgi:hypothetical protein
MLKKVKKNIRRQSASNPPPKKEHGRRTQPPPTLFFRFRVAAAPRLVCSAGLRFASGGGIKMTKKRVFDALTARILADNE